MNYDKCCGFNKKLYAIKTLIVQNNTQYYVKNIVI